MTQSLDSSKQTLENQLNSLLIDVTSLKTSLDTGNTLSTELRADHATMKTSYDAMITLITELKADHATFKTLADATKTLLNNIRTSTQAYPLGKAGLVIDTNFDAKNGVAIDFSIAGVAYTLSINTNCDTLTAATFPATKWGIFLVSADISSALDATWDTNSGAGYDSEAEAIAALPATPADQCPIGYVTVLAHGSNSFTAGTDALQGGSGGNVSPDTNYYDLTDAQSVVSAAVSDSSPDTVGSGTPAAGPETLVASDPTAVGSLNSTAGT